MSEDVLTTDDIFDSDDVGTKTEKTGEVNIFDEQVSNNEDLPAKDDVVEPESDLGPVDERLPKLIGDDFPVSFKEAYSRAIALYEDLPVLEEAEIYAELGDLTVRSKQTGTIDVVNQELQRVQAAKERLSEIMVNVLRCHTVKKRIVDILFDAWMSCSSASSTDKRKGDASLRLIEFETDLSRTESLMKATNHIARNLDSLQDNLSRRITIFQLQLKLQDVGRGALPEYDFNDIKDKDVLGSDKIESYEDPDDDNEEEPAPEICDI